jgi:hypothetical protein
MHQTHRNFQVRHAGFVDKHNNYQQYMVKHNSMNLGLVVPCIFKYSNKITNQMQQSVVKFIA